MTLSVLLIYDLKKEFADRKHIKGGGGELHRFSALPSEKSSDTK